jgi:hypothetical protein
MSSNTSPDRDEQQVNRRRVLRSIGAAGAAVAATGRAAGAPGISDAHMESVREPYNDITTVRSLVRNEQELLEAVASAGHIDDASIDALGVETLGEPASERDGFAEVGVRRDGRGLTADVRVVNSFEDGRLQVSIEPEYDRAFALFTDAESGTSSLVYSTNYCDCNPNEECVIVCENCSGYKVTCYCDPPGVVDQGIERPKCQCTENCGGW